MDLLISSSLPINPIGVGAFFPFIIYSLPVLIISRIIMVSCAGEFYMGFILPDWVKKLLL